MNLDLPGIRIERSSDGHSFLFEERYGFVYLLNDLAEFVLHELIKGDRTEEELVAAIRLRFDLQSDADPLGDVKLFISKLRTYGLLI